jgi:hypothetical protein
MSAPRTRDECAVPYRRELTLELARQQARLRESFELVATRYREGGRADCLARLGEFDRELRVYLAQEGVRFEAYMRYLLADDAESLKLMNRLRARMRGLSHYIHALVQGHEEGRLAEQGYLDFGASLDRVSAGLQQVFECQQTLLFPLYRPLQSSH